MNISIFSNILKFLNSYNNIKNINYNQSIDDILKNIKISNLTPLELAVSYQFLEEVDYFLENGGDPNQDTYDDIPLLFKACLKDDINLVVILVKRGADIKKLDKNGNNALHYTKNKNIEKYLIYKGIQK